MAKDKELNDLSKALLNMTLAQQLQRDMDKWMATLAEGGANTNKQNAIKRMLLLIGSGKLELLGNKGVDGEVKQVSQESNQLPIAFYLSGHGGRVYMSFENNASEQVLDWVTSGNKDSDQGIHKGSYFLPGNRGGDLKDNEIVYDRHSATHSAKVDKDGNIKELKGAWYGAIGMLDRMLSYVTPISYFSAHSEHLGMNVPFGGKRYKNIQADIRDDGGSGHLYFNLGRDYNSGRDFMGVGMEGTAPMTEGPLGAHSSSGGADRFTPGEGQKSFVKFDAKDANFIAYLTELVGEKAAKWDEIKEREYVFDKNNWNFLRRIIARISALLFGEKVELISISSVKDIAKLTKEEQIKVIEELGLYVLKDEKGKDEMISTTLGSHLINAGMTVPYNYNGQKIKFTEEALNGVLGYAENLPDEIIYFKPQENLTNFMAQAKVFSGIDRKELIKENPQLSLTECFALSLAYDSDQGFAPATLDEAKEKLEKMIEVIGDQGVEKYDDILKNLKGIQ